LEDYGGIVIKPGASDSYGYKPKWIVIKNLELSGAAAGNTFISLTGATLTYGDSAGIWMQPSADVTLENNVIYDNAFGVFTMAKDDLLLAACERIIVRNSRIYGNGRINNDRDHNLYIQSTNPIIEGNYIGQTRVGSQGSSYKSRSSGEIFRYNYVEASARAIDLVQSEDQSQGIAIQSDYGQDFLYGNIIVNDCNLPNCASEPIHYGGDNMGEQDDTATVFVPEAKYRSLLFFYNNTVINKSILSQQWRVQAFDLSLVGTQVEAWNNIFYFEGTSNFSWVQSAGNLKLRGSNLVFGTVNDSDERALNSNFKIQKLGTIVTQNPQFVSSNDYNLKAASPAANVGSMSVPSGIVSNINYMQVPVVMSPLMKSNGMSPRTVSGSNVDLGATEAQ
jgi:hypothetical protein